MNNFAFNYGGNAGGTLAPFLEGVAGFMGAIVIVFYLLLFAASIVSYVLQAIGLRAVGKRRSIHHSWMAWIPVGNSWLLGSISDQYRYVAKGRVKNRRGLLMGLDLAVVIISVIMFFLQFAGGFYTVLEKNGLAGMMAGFSSLLSFASFVLTVIYSVFKFIALHDLYASCNPSKKVPFLLLSIFFSATIPFFIFFGRKNDFGMPPRKREIPVDAEVVEPTADFEIEIYDEEPAPETDEVPEVIEISVDKETPAVEEDAETPEDPE